MRRSLCVAALVVFAGACTARALFPAGGDTSSHGQDGGGGGNGDGGLLSGFDIAGVSGDGFNPSGDGFSGGGTDDIMSFDQAQPIAPPMIRGGHAAAGVWLLTRDLNKDSRQDLVVLQSNGTVRVYLGDGAGGLSIGQSFEINTSTAVTMGVLADVDGDGLPDLVVAEPGKNEVDIHRANSNGSTFGDWARLAAPGGVQSVAVGDLDDDGAQDIVALALDGTIRVFSGTKGGKPQPMMATFQTTAGAQQIALVDANHDGHLDALTFGPDGSIAILTGDGALHFAASSTLPAPSSPSRFAFGDFDRNGAPDLAALGVSGNVVGVNVNWDVGSMRLPTSVPRAGAVDAVKTGGLAAGDMTGDGFDDLVFVGDSSVVLEIAVSDRQGGFIADTFHSMGLDEAAVSIVLADFNSDGLLDVAATGATKTQLYLSSHF